MRVRYWVAGAVVVFLVAAVVLAPRVLRRLAFFRVRQIEVVGTRYLDEHDVASRLALGKTASVFDPLDAVRKSAVAIPGVLAATVERRLPGTIRVTLREARPVAAMPGDDRLGLMDSAGHALPFDPTRAPTPLPLAPRDSGVAALLGRLATADPDLYASVESASLEKGDVVLDVGGRSVRLTTSANEDVFRAIAAVQDYLVKHPQPWRELDARYHTRVFLRKGPA